MIKKILGTFTAISSIIWLAFFLNGVDQGHYDFVLVAISIINILLLVKTKFWKKSTEQKEEIKIIRLLCVIGNIVLAVKLLKIMNVEFDLNDQDDIYIAILMFIAILAPFIYLLAIKKDYL